MAEKFGTATPPAAFPSILGLLGVGLAWRRAADLGIAPDWIGEFLIGAFSAVFVYAFVAYLTKISRSAAAIPHDLSTLPGRAGLSAACVSGLLLAVGVLPYSPSAAAALLVIFFALQFVVAVSVGASLARMPLEGRRMNPTWHLSFVGFIVAPVPAIALGWTEMAEIVAILTFPMAVTIWLGLTWMALRGARTPPPLRPLLAINLGPSSLLGLAALGLGAPGLGLVFGLFSLGIFAALILRARWIVEAGFSPFWGSFTFPLAAFTNLTLELGQGSGPFHWLSLVLLPAVTLFVLYIGQSVLAMWMAGTLAAKTNAARAG